MSVRKLYHYFKAHRLRVLTNESLIDIFGSSDSSCRIEKWAMELSEHVIDLERRNAIKSQVLADFIIDLERRNAMTGVLRRNLGKHRSRGRSNLNITFGHQFEVCCMLAVHDRNR
jgi:hypothetical protein